MPKNARAVLIGDIIVSDSPDDVLVVYGLSSCVAVCLYDPVKRLGGMIHTLLPHAANHRQGPLSRYVDEGLPMLLDAMVERGALRYRLHAYLCGGARILSLETFSNLPNIGARNLKAAYATLDKLRLRIRAEATGGAVGRTVRLYVETGQVTIKTVHEGERPLV